MEATYDPVLDNESLKKKRTYWEVAFGLQAVDGLKSFEYVRELADEAFRFDVLTFKSYHRRLFERLDAKVHHSGEFRTVNLTKKEPVLDGKSVQYQDYGMNQESLEYDFAEERVQDYLKNYSNIPEGVRADDVELKGFFREILEK